MDWRAGGHGREGVHNTLELRPLCVCVCERAGGVRACVCVKQRGRLEDHEGEGV